MAFKFKTFAAVGALIGSLALVGCGQDRKRYQTTLKSA
ncbi:DL-methionine transporter substrate-binding subunit [Escherichia coli ECA-727]|nr:DL-methionine transporter substrate-binding subunit [Escherichia coli ECA-727]